MAVKVLAVETMRRAPLRMPHGVSTYMHKISGAQAPFDGVSVANILLSFASQDEHVQMRRDHSKVSLNLQAVVQSSFKIRCSSF